MVDSNSKEASEDGGSEAGSLSPPTNLSLTSDEVNYLVYRYLQESGFVHSAFSFAHESMLGRTGLRNADNKALPPGALITFLQKGLQYVGIEESLRSNEAVDNFSILSPQAITAIARKDPPIQLNVPPATAAAAIKARLEKQQQLQPAFLQHPTLSSQQDMARQALAAQAAAAHAAAMSQLHMPQFVAADLMALQQQQQQQPPFVAEKRNASQVENKQRKAKKQKKEKKNLSGFATLEEAAAQLEKQRSSTEPMDMETSAHEDEPAKPLSDAVNGTHNGPQQDMKTPLNGASQKMPKAPSEAMSAAEVDDTDTAVEPHEVLKLEMHQSEVFMCAWNPVYTDLIATGSGDASARIWQMGGLNASDGLMTVKLLPHGSDPGDRKNKDVTTLEWSSDGTLLATGSYDGVARVWARNGALVHTLRGHNGPIFSLKWNKQGNYLLSGSYDKTTIVWDVSGSTGFVEQQFTDHEAPALDVDWKDNTTFASCSTDRTVHICRVGVSRPLKVFSGHTDEVNAVKWDPSGRYLASCSDDCTAKIWDVELDRKGPLHDLTAHQQEIYTVKWSPTGPGSNNPTKRPLLATASFDGSVRLWNVSDGSCYRVFSRHRDSVYSVAFSPSGDFLASGSLAGVMYIWNIEEGRHIKSYKGNGDIFEVAWNKEESRIAACFSSNVVAIIDFSSSNS